MKNFALVLLAMILIAGVSVNIVSASEQSYIIVSVKPGYYVFAVKDPAFKNMTCDNKFIATLTDELVSFKYKNASCSKFNDTIFVTYTVDNYVVTEHAGYKSLVIIPPALKHPVIVSVPTSIELNGTVYTISNDSIARVKGRKVGNSYLVYTDSLEPIVYVSQKEVNNVGFIIYDGRDSKLVIELADNSIPISVTGCVVKYVDKTERVVTCSDGGSIRFGKKVGIKLAFYKGTVAINSDGNRAIIKLTNCNPNPREETVTAVLIQPSEILFEIEESDTGRSALYVVIVAGVAIALGAAIYKVKLSKPRRKSGSKSK